jgi:hypothetical protein
MKRAAGLYAAALRSLRWPVAAAVLAMPAACHDPTPLATIVPPPDPPTVPLDTLPVRRAALVYERVGEHDAPAGAHSRYVLFDDETFRLYFVTAERGFFEYAGRYTRTDSILTFSFDDGSWQATGTAHEDMLLVVYNFSANMNGFEDGVYILARDHFVVSGQIHVANADGSAAVRITRGSWPSWSPDGRTLAFHREGHVYLIDADGSGERRLVAGGLAAWSPDGRRIAFTNALGMATIGVDGSGAATFLRHDFRGDTNAEHDMGIGKPAWSPDGRFIAFEHFGDGEVQPAQIFVMDVFESDTPRRVTNSADGGRYAESDPAWSPTWDSRLVFWSYRYGIATVPASGGEPSSVYLNFPTVAYGARPGWSADGSTLAFTAGRSGTDGPAIWTVPATGGAATLLIARGEDAVWSPDGARIAFVVPAEEVVRRNAH